MPRYLPAGESALVVEYGSTAERAFHDKVLALDAALTAAPIEGVRETVPTYRSLMIHFDPRVLTTDALADRLDHIALDDAPKRETKRWRLPACYEEPHAEDIAELAAALDMAPQEIAALHAGARYRVVMYGFAPGFVFLDGLPEELRISRRQTPRGVAKPGALTIANGQALIASIAMPTGWYVLGRTPMRTFDTARDPAFPIAVGDEVRFEPVDAARFDDLERQAASGSLPLEAGRLVTTQLIIEGCGPGCTVQDGGRVGWLRYGVTPAGPMDWTALRTANIALANDPDAAALEIGPGGVTLAVNAPLSLCVAGGSFAWSHDDGKLPHAFRILLRPGERLRGRAGERGAFAYCAVPRGFDLPAIMGSRATHTRSAMGGLDGRQLAGGDRLTVFGAAPDLDDAEIKAPWLAPSDAPIRIVLGPQDDAFAEASIAAFQDASYTLSAAADRMAYKFEGPKLDHVKDFNIVSDGVALGAVQVAGDKQPMVLMADRQPTGGYAKIAHVCRADIGRLAQLRPGGSCRFRVVSVAEARDALIALEDKVAATPERLHPLRRTPIAARLFADNLVGGVTGADV